MSGPMDAVGLIALYRDFAKPHKVVPKDGVRTCFRLCELSWYYQVLKARHVVEQAEGRPVLYSYGSDSTPHVDDEHGQQSFAHCWQNCEEGRERSGVLAGEGLCSDH